MTDFGRDPDWQKATFFKLVFVHRGRAFGTRFFYSTLFHKKEQTKPQSLTQTSPFITALFLTYSFLDSLAIFDF
jgi:hypothetical protein